MSTASLIRLNEPPKPSPYQDLPWLPPPAPRSVASARGRPHGPERTTRATRALAGRRVEPRSLAVSPSADSDQSGLSVTRSPAAIMSGAASNLMPGASTGANRASSETSARPPPSRKWCCRRAQTGRSSCPERQAMRGLAHLPADDLIAETGAETLSLKGPCGGAGKAAAQDRQWPSRAPLRL